MSDTIREQIIQAVISKLSEISVDNGYTTDCGANVQRAAPDIASENMPACNVIPRPDEQTTVEYGRQVAIMPVEVQALQVHGENNPSVIGEQALGDLISCLMGTERVLSFTSGGTYQIAVGNTVTGATSGATGRVIAVTLTSGSWSAGTAAGTLRFRTQTGTFQAENLNVGSNLNVATIADDSIQQAGKTTLGLIDRIEYAGGGIEDYPEAEDPHTIVMATFNVRYMTLLGNPYAQ